MHKRSILLTISLSWLVAIGCDSTSTSSPSDGGLPDATTDSPSTDDTGVDASPESAGEAAIDAGEAGDSSPQPGDGGDAQGMEAGDAPSPVDAAADAGDALISVDAAADAGDALSLDAGDSASDAETGQ